VTEAQPQPAIQAESLPTNQPGPKEKGRLPELLAPAGDWDCARAAVENGADAIYFGLERFNARMRARNFTEADLPALVDYLHRRGVKAYVTLNTLVFQNELAEAEQYLRAMIVAGVDAVIIQDVGISRLLRQISPDFPIHASTQMTITSVGGIAFAKDLGCHLVVLARECSLREIGIIQSGVCSSEQGPPAVVARNSEERPVAGSSLPIEVFVHGALCVAYSGQCLTSESLGGRSANRGECAQACRMPYELIADGQKVPLGDRRYLLSPQDLAGLSVLPELARLGIASLKIEGRLKSPEYVANVTRVYRCALDRLATGMDRLVEDSRYDLEMAFSRGLSTGWFGGINNQALVHARFGKKRGVYLGEVTRVEQDRVQLRLHAPLKPGDGIVFDAGQPEKDEEGGRVFEIAQRGAEASLSFGRGSIDFRRVHPGDRVWKTSDPELERRLRESFSGKQPRFQRPVDLDVHGILGEPLTLIVRDEIGNVVQVSSSMPLVQAQAQPLTEQRLRDQLGRLGGTPFRLARLQNLIQGDTILPISELNRMRRHWVSRLEDLRARPMRWTVYPAPAGTDRDLPQQTGSVLPPAVASDTRPPSELIVMVRNLDQLDAALECGIATLYCEFEDPKRYREAVERFRGWPHRDVTTKASGTIWVAPPRIFKMGEDWILKQARSANADGYLVRNYDHLRWFEGCRCIGDYTLNVANKVSAEYFKNKFSLERVTASYDLNSTQLEALLRAAPPDWFEVTIHQHMPMFHMEHCVFCAFLSKGTDYSNCGRPCDKHDLQLLDRVGAKHPVKADAGCRNTVFNALAQTGAEHVARLQRLGVRSFRIEFLNEAPELVKQTIQQYQHLLTGQISGSALWRELKLLNQLGVTRGTGSV
jgi:putative protease